MSVQLNINCLSCINRQYPQNCIEFDKFCSIFIQNTCLDNHRQSFWWLHVPTGWNALAHRSFTHVHCRLPAFQCAWVHWTRKL